MASGSTNIFSCFSRHVSWNVGLLAGTLFYFLSLLSFVLPVLHVQVVLGEQFELHMDEDDEYYNARFMNNQSLDTILYGNDPVNLDEKLTKMIEDMEEEQSMYVPEE